MTLASSASKNSLSRVIQKRAHSQTDSPLSDNLHFKTTDSDTQPEDSASKRHMISKVKFIPKQVSYIDSLIAEYANGNNPQCDKQRTAARAMGIISGAANYEEAAQILIKLEAHSLVDPLHYNALIMRCENRHQVLDLLNRLIEQQIPIQTSTYNSAITKCEKLGNYKTALKIFSRMPDALKDIITFNKIIAINVTLDRWDECKNKVQAAINSKIYTENPGLRIVKKGNLYINFHTTEILTVKKKLAYGHTPSIPLEVSKAIFYYHLGAIQEALNKHKFVFIIVGENGINYLKEGMREYIQSNFSHFNVNEHRQIKGQLVISSTTSDKSAASATP